MTLKILKIVTALHLTWIVLTVASFAILIASKGEIPHIIVGDTFILCIQCGFGIVVSSAVTLGIGVAKKNAYLIISNTLAFLISLPLSLFVWYLLDGLASI